MDAIGLILAGGSGEKLKDLTATRAISALPIGGNYRTIDFTLSNMSNSGIKRVGVITQYNSRSLREHLSSAKWWDLGRKNGGLHVFSPYLSPNNMSWLYRGTADSMIQNLDFLLKCNETYVVIASGDHVYNMDFREALDYHKKKKSDITIIYKKFAKKSKLSRYGVLELDEDNRLVGYEEKPIDPLTENGSLGVYIIKRTLLISLLQEIAKEEKYDFVSDVIIRYKRKYNIMGYEFKGYWKGIYSVDSYFKTNMDLLKNEVRSEVFHAERTISSKLLDVPPAKFNPEAKVKNSIIAGGCIVEGKVEGSIMFHGVHVGKNSLVKNSIIMEGCFIGNDVVLENVILDHNTIVSDGKVLGREEEILVIPNEVVI